jgi:hypothetical protein
VDFLKVFGVVLVVAVPMCWVPGLIPLPAAALIAGLVLGAALYAHKNRSLV